MTLERYRLRSSFLKETTTRQTSPDGEGHINQLENGEALAQLKPAARDQALIGGIEVLRMKVSEWLDRQNLKISCNSAHSPSTWVRSILKEAEGKSGGRVEQHLVGAKLQRRYPKKNIPNYPGHAGDAQTGRRGDFDIDSVSYHVTAAPGPDVIRKCKAKVDNNRRPILVVPRDKVEKARTMAELEGIEDHLTILALEDFIANNVIEISVERQADFLATLKKIIEEYNRRVQAVETDTALKIELQ